VVKKLDFKFAMPIGDFSDAIAKQSCVPDYLDDPAAAYVL
jgi:hypothetical protein